MPSTILAGGTPRVLATYPAPRVVRGDVRAVPRGRAGCTRPEPFSAPEDFPFPEGIGPVECVNVEHEEVLLVPRRIKARRVTFKYALGSDFIDKLKTIHLMGMDRTDPVDVKGVSVSPRDVLAAVTPDPVSLGDRMVGRAIVGTWVIGREDGRPREVFLYQMADAQETLRTTGSQVVGWQTGFSPVIVQNRAPSVVQNCPPGSAVAA